jgi:hypothetical protein
VSLPGAAELFRSTVPDGQPQDTDEPVATDLRSAVATRAGSPAVQRAIGEAVQRAVLRAVPAQPAPTPTPAPLEPPRTERVQLSLPSELVLELERARAILAREHGLPVSRAEVVAAALAEALHDFDARAEDSTLVRRLAED